MFKRILVPTDGSPFSQNTVHRAVSFAKEAGASITALYVKPKNQAGYYGQGVVFDWVEPGQYDEATEKEAQQILGFVENLCWREGVSCTKVTKSSNVIYEAIIEAATKNDCDLIIMASHGRSGMGALLLGSETTKVLTHSKIPVLVCR